MTTTKRHIYGAGIVNVETGNVVVKQDINYFSANVQSATRSLIRFIEDQGKRFNENQIYDGLAISNGGADVDVASGTAYIGGRWVSVDADALDVSSLAADTYNVIVHVSGVSEVQSRDPSTGETINVFLQASGSWADDDFKIVLGSAITNGATVDSVQNRAFRRVPVRNIIPYGTATTVSIYAGTKPVYREAAKFSASQNDFYNPLFMNGWSISGSSINAVDFNIGSKSLGQTEFDNLDGHDQGVRIADQPTFAGINLNANYIIYTDADHILMEMGTFDIYWDSTTNQTQFRNAAGVAQTTVDHDTGDITTLGVIDGIDLATKAIVWDAKQDQGDILDDLKGLTQTISTIPYFDSATTAALLTFRDQDDMTGDDATGVASQQSIKAYDDKNRLASHQLDLTEMRNDASNNSVMSLRNSAHSGETHWANDGTTPGAGGEFGIEGASRSFQVPDGFTKIRAVIGWANDFGLADGQLDMEIFTEINGVEGASNETTLAISTEEQYRTPNKTVAFGDNIRFRVRATTNTGGLPIDDFRIFYVAWELAA